MFRGVKPAGQPRTARTNAEAKNGPGNFTTVAVPPQVRALPYADPADAAKSQAQARRELDAATPSPFKNMKG